MKALAFMCLAVLSFGCMSDYELMLRYQDLKLKEKHQETYSPITLKGPMYLMEGSEITGNVPNFPYSHSPIPDGQAYQVDMANKVLNTATILGAGYLMKRAGDEGDTNIYNNGGKK